MDRVKELNYYEIGHGYPVVLIHGGNVDPFSWILQIPLAYQYRLILPELRGRGKSPRSPKGCSMALMASDVNRLLEKLGVEQAVICGVSYGGAVALQLAIDYGGKVRALVLSDTMSRVPASRTTADQPSTREAILQISSSYKGGQEGMQKLKEHLMSIIDSSDFANSSVGRMLMDEQTERFSGLDPDSLWENMQALLAFDVHDRLSEIHVPTLIIGAKEDEIVQAEECKELHKGIEASEYVEVEGGHGTVFRRADLWNGILKAFLEKLALNERSV